MNPTEISNEPSSFDRKPAPPVSLISLLAALAASVALFDVCFWKVAAWGFSVAVFFVLMTAIILWLRRGGKLSRVTRVCLVLQAGAAVSATLETGFTNTTVLLILLVVVSGDSYFVHRTSAWERGFCQMSALVRAPGRIFWLAARLMEAGWKTGGGMTVRLLGLCALVLPAFFLVLIFGSLLGAGNAVFAYWTSSFFHWLGSLFSIDPLRILLWCAGAFMALPFLRPAFIRDHKWRWIHHLPRFPEIVPASAAHFGSTLVLISLNALFLAANMADAIFLWSGRRLPPGVGYSAFVHQGVDTLTLTVLISAVVLIAVLKQMPSVAGRRSLKGWAVAWIAQNLFLLVSIALRLKLYIEAYDMSVERLGVIIFLVFIASCYLLLTIKILREKSLSWQLGACLIALFTTFYLTQFLDLRGWVADYNVAAWAKGRIRHLDVWYLQRLGPEAWPALYRAHQISPQDPVITTAWQATGNSAKLTRFTWDSWREFSLRAWENRAAVAPER